MTMLPLDEAAAVVCSLLPRPAAATVPVAAAAGRVLAANAHAAVANPPFDRAMMDGFAVRSTDAHMGARLRVTGCLPAGSAGGPAVGPGEAVRIMTGAPVPAGADAVIRFEWCEAKASEVTVLRAVPAGEAVQPAGSDAPRGALVVPAGQRLTAADLAVLQGFGVAHVRVWQPLRAAVLVTGSELQTQPAAPLAPGQIYSSNDLYLATALAEEGVSVLDVVHVPDDPKSLAQQFTRLAQQADVVVAAGGISAGDCDYVPAVLRQLGATLAVERVWMRPGTPFCAGRLQCAAVFALSGNPAACLVQFETLLRPALRSLLGIRETSFPCSGKLVHALTLKPLKHARVLRGLAWIEEGQVLLDLRLAQAPSVLSSLASSQCLVRIDQANCPAGTLLPMRWLRPPGSPPS
ncbi:MAG: molybdopterin molybdotransferase MoeA [Alicyclobacillus sp.]|nr:molybdopterin molybdotransferase MoeA [Alicyclobacillus sp.]